MAAPRFKIILVLLLAACSETALAYKSESLFKERIKNALIYYFSTLPDLEKLEPLSNERITNFLQNNQQIFELTDDSLKKRNKKVSSVPLPMPHKTFLNVLDLAAKKAKLKVAPYGLKLYQNTFLRLINDIQIARLTEKALEAASQDEPIPEPSPSPSPPSFLKIKPILRVPAAAPEISGWRILPPSKRIQSQIKKLRDQDRNIFIHLQKSLEKSGYPKDWGNARPVLNNLGLFYSFLKNSDSAALWQVTGNSIRWLFVGAVPRYRRITKTTDFIENREDN